MDRLSIELQKEYLNSITTRMGFTLTVENICELLQVSRPIVDNLLATGVIKSVKIGKSYRVAADDFIIWLHQAANKSQLEAQTKILKVNL